MLQLNFGWMARRRFFFQRFLFMVLALSMFAELAWTQAGKQPDQMVRDGIAANRAKIDTAASWHATDEQLGVLWRHLADDYAAEFEMQRSEDAFMHSVKLLRTLPAQTLYAGTLTDLASLYLSTDRLKEAESCGNKALAIYEGIGDQRGAVQVRTGLAIALLHGKRFAEAEEVSAKALKSLEEHGIPDRSNLVAGLLANSYAKCFQNRCEEGLVAARQAMGVADAAFARDSSETISSLLAVGFEEWKTGATVDGDKAMREALELVHQKTNVPYPMLVDAQLRVLTYYTNFLKATHQKTMAKQMENEITRLKEEQTPSCKNCTVNVMTLAAR
jgi:tetratricopeptide (TPR) repeat protein